MKEAPIKLNPLGPHYYADLPRGHRAGLPDLVEDVMNNLTLDPFNPDAHGGEYVPRKAFVTAHETVGVFRWDDEHDGNDWPDYEVELRDPDDGEWFNDHEVHDWDF